jgi:hypothetical protein
VGGWTAVINGNMPFFKAEVFGPNLNCYYGAGDGQKGVSISVAAPRSGHCTVSGRDFVCQ